MPRGSRHSYSCSSRFHQGNTFPGDNSPLNICNNLGSSRLQNRNNHHGQGDYNYKVRYSMFLLTQLMSEVNLTEKQFDIALQRTEELHGKHFRESSCTIFGQKCNGFSLEIQLRRLLSPMVPSDKRWLLTKKVFQHSGILAFFARIANFTRKSLNMS